MNLKQKFLVVLAFVVLAASFGGGVWVGTRIDRPEVDPQDYIETVFTPYDSGLENFLEFLDLSRKSVYIADYAFTHPLIVDKLIELKTKHGVEIRILLDKSQTVSRSGQYEKAQIARLEDAGIEVLVGTSEKKHALLHSKYTVVDELYVQSGSWNYTKSADDQANTLDFVKSKKRARLFLDNWHKMYKYIKSQKI